MSTTGRPRILLAEDEAHIAKGLVYNLEKRGYEVEHVARGDLALAAASTDGFDLIVLDVMMPGLDGVTVCERLRAGKILTPILMLTARSELENRIDGLRKGADDYVGKPFNLEELMMRAEALLRRRQWDDPGDARRAVVKLGAAEFDSNLLELRGAGRVVALTMIESRLLHYLIAEKGNTLSRAQILMKVWGFHEDTQTRTLDNFIMRLRNHLGAVGGSSGWIESVRGIGYRFDYKS